METKILLLTAFVLLSNSALSKQPAWIALNLSEDNKSESVVDINNIDRIGDYSNIILSVVNIDKKVKYDLSQSHFRFNCKTGTVDFPHFTTYLKGKELNREKNIVLGDYVRPGSILSSLLKLSCNKIPDNIRNLKPLSNSFDRKTLASDIQSLLRARQIADEKLDEALKKAGYLNKLLLKNKSYNEMMKLFEKLNKEQDQSIKQEYMRQISLYEENLKGDTLYDEYSKLIIDIAKLFQDYENKTNILLGKGFE